MKTTTFVYEAIRDVGPETSALRLFEALGLPFSPVAVDGWDRVPSLGEPGSRIVWPPMPPSFAVPHIHDRVRQASGLTFFSRDAGIAALPPGEVRRITENGLGELYARWRRRCARDLELDLGSPLSSGVAR